MKYGKHGMLAVVSLLAFGAQAKEPWLKSELALTLEGVSNLHGGIDEDTRTLENFDLTITADTTNAYWLSSNKFYIWAKYY